MNKAIFHLPGLYEFHELYKRFLPLYKEHNEYFYEWCVIGSIYGAPGDARWGGGRLSSAYAKTEDVITLLNTYDITPRLTFSNSLLTEDHLNDPFCNEICHNFEKMSRNSCGVIITSDLLMKHLKENYPSFHYISSTTKVITDTDELHKELNRDEFRYVVPDFRLNKAFSFLSKLSEKEKDKTEFLLNECCWTGCKDRKICYETVSHQNLDENWPEHICKAPGNEKGYRFSSAMKNPAFISVEDIINTYLPMGFSNFKIEGRGLGSALILEFLLYYLVKPEYQLTVREEIYLSNTLDLF